MAPRNEARRKADVPPFPRQALTDLAEHFRLCGQLDQQGSWARWAGLCQQAVEAYDAATKEQVPSGHGPSIV